MVTRSLSIRWWTPAVTLTLLGTVVGCGGGDASSSSKLGATAVPRSVVHVAAEPAGANCPAGGVRIIAGWDANADGRVGEPEEGSSHYVCHGAVGGVGTAGATGASGPQGSTGATGGVGVSGLSALVRLVPVLSGSSHCPTGGTRVEVGQDADRDGMLDTNEVASSSHACNGAHGTDGANGLTSLVAIVTEPIGSNCPYGGSRVISGLDADEDGVLRSSEATSVGFICMGPPAGLTFVNVTGSAVQAETNTGYIANNASTVVTVTLPAAAAVGDIVRVTGAAAGGWRIAQNAGQSIQLGRRSFAGRNPVAQWTGFAFSADGQDAVASGGCGYVWRSTDRGVSWSMTTLPYACWMSIASSADGSRIAAGMWGGDVHISEDSGITWRAAGLPVRRWLSLAISADGARLVASDPDNGFLYVSTDVGVSWTPRDSPRDWTSVASSSDGLRLIASAYNGQLYTSIDGGVTWSPRAVAAEWTRVVSSADGSTLAATRQFAPILMSTDGGASWFERAEATHRWRGLAMSADGRTLVASAMNGQVHRSVDGGTVWETFGAINTWEQVGISPDGRHLVAGGYNTLAYSMGAPVQTSVGTSGGVLGSQLDTLELQYGGGGRWLQTTVVGLPVAF